MFEVSLGGVNCACHHCNERFTGRQNTSTDAALYRKLILKGDYVPSQSRDHASTE